MSTALLLTPALEGRLCRSCGGLATYLQTRLCRPCNAASQREWRAKQSADWHEEQRARWRASSRKEAHERRVLIDAAKDQPCTDCGRQFPSYVMQFDHVRGTKSFTISRYSSRGWKRDELEAEIAKCEVVCANCHAMRTHGRRN